jgi:hypothetical protein
VKKRTLERLRRKWENNITRDLEEITLGHNLDCSGSE